jgi:hypothetical protein
MALTKCKECDAEISKKAAGCPNCGAPAKKKTSRFTWLVVIFLGLVAGPNVLLLMDLEPLTYDADAGWHDTDPSTAHASPSVTLTPKEAAMKNTKLDFTWGKKYDTLMQADFTITNRSYHEIKDIEIKCTHSAKSGTRIDSNTRTIFDVVQANSKRTFSDFDMGFIHSQVEKSHCAIVDLEVVE